MEENLELYCQDNAFITQLRDVINYNGLMIYDKDSYDLTQSEICDFFLDKIPK